MAVVPIVVLLVVSATLSCASGQQTARGLYPIDSSSRLIQLLTRNRHAQHILISTSSGRDKFGPAQVTGEVLELNTR